MMQYKGYSAQVAFDDQDNVFHGEVWGIRDVVTFQGTNVAELRQAFRDSVDDYLEFCRQRGEAPEKPFSGRFLLRIPAGLHREIAALAQREGKSLNSWVVSRLEKHVQAMLARIRASGNSARKRAGSRAGGKTQKGRRARDRAR